MSTTVKGTITVTWALVHGRWLQTMVLHTKSKGAPKDLLKSGQKVKVQGQQRRCHDVCHDWSCPGV